MLEEKTQQKEEINIANPLYKTEATDFIKSLSKKIDIKKIKKIFKIKKRFFHNKISWWYFNKNNIPNEISPVFVDYEQIVFWDFFITKKEESFCAMLSKLFKTITQNFFEMLRKLFRQNCL